MQHLKVGLLSPLDCQCPWNAHRCVSFALRCSRSRARGEVELTWTNVYLVCFLLLQEATDWQICEINALTKDHSALASVTRRIHRTNTAVFGVYSSPPVFSALAIYMLFLFCFFFNPLLIPADSRRVLNMWCFHWGQSVEAQALQQEMKEICGV